MRQPADMSTALPANDYLRIDAVYNTAAHAVTWFVYDDSTNDSLLASRTFTVGNVTQPQTADAKLSLLDNSYSTHPAGQFRWLISTADSRRQAHP